MHMKWLLALTVSVMLLVGCATEEPPQEVDVPVFSEGQATALVKEVIRNKYSHEGLYFDFDDLRPDVIVRTELVCAAVRTVFMQEPQRFEESYEGRGVWLVDLDTTEFKAAFDATTISVPSDYLFERVERDEILGITDLTFGWKVYENTGTVISTGETTVDDGSIEYRFYC